MFSNSNTGFLWPLICAALGVFCIISGVKTLLTGKLSIREESRLNEYSEKGTRIYKIVYSIINIIAGLVCIGFAIVKYLATQGIITDLNPYRIGGIAFIVVLVVVLVITKSQCKKMV